ncbi:MAG: serine/threonine-protein kinase, partial [Polyangiaceae bacterium]
MSKVVGGKYHLIAHLGGGTTSDVSLARVEGAAPGAELAVVKRLKLGADADPDLLAQFADEARVWLRLKHPNIAEALAAAEDTEGAFLVLEYLEGQTLARVRSRASRRAGGLPRPVALHIVMQVATGLGYAHEAKDDGGKPLQIVHRDVSPENILVTYAGATKVIDFSVATAKTAFSKGRAGATKGNIAYMAPEQSKSGVRLDERADVFALGLVLWEILAGKRMWEGTSEADILARLADDTPLPSLRSVVPDMPESLDAICAQALAKVRDDRFDTAAALKEAIEKAIKPIGLETTTAEVAAFVTSLFEDERAKMQAMVAEALAAPGDSGHSLPRLPATPESTGQLPAVASDPQLPVEAAAPAAKPIRVVEVVRIEQPSRDRRFTLMVGGAVLIAFALVAVV